MLANSNETWLSGKSRQSLCFWYFINWLYGIILFNQPMKRFIEQSCNGGVDDRMNITRRSTLWRVQVTSDCTYFAFPFQTRSEYPKED